MANVNIALKNESGDISELAGASISRSGGRSNSIGKIGVTVAAMVLSGFNAESEGNIMRSLGDNQGHIDRGNQFTLLGRAAQGLGGGVVSMRITAPGTSVAINYSGVAIRSFADGSGWILGTNHPVGDLSGSGFGHETITVGLSGNYITSGETRLTVTQSVALLGSGSRDPNSRDMRLYFVSGGLPQFTPMQLVTMDQVPLNSYLDFAGFGRWGTQANGFQTTTGDVRSFVAQYASASTSGGYSNQFYRQALTAPSDTTPSLGRGASGYSGCYVGYENMMCGIVEYGTNGTIFQGNTGFNFFDHNVVAEINQITSVPTPGGVAAITIAAAAFGWRGRRRD